MINKKKRTCRIVDFAVPADHMVKLKESEMKDQCLDLARKLKKKQTVEQEIDVYTNCIGVLGTVTKGVVLGLEDLEIRE